MENKIITFKASSGEKWYSTQGLKGQLINTIQIENKNHLFMSKNNEILFSYNNTGTEEKSVDITLFSNESFSGKTIIITTVLSGFVAQKTPSNVNDITPYLGLVRFASDKELEIATVGNENGATVTPKQVLDLVKNAKFRRSLSNDDFPLPGDIQYKTFCDKSVWCIYTVKDGIGDWVPLAGGEKGPQGPAGEYNLQAGLMTLIEGKTPIINLKNMSSKPGMSVQQMDLGIPASYTPILRLNEDDGCLYVEYKQILDPNNILPPV